VEGIAQLFKHGPQLAEAGPVRHRHPRRPGDHVQTGRPTHKVFKVRCWRAPRSMQANAIATGLVAEIGQDRCQQIITEAFRKVR